MSGLSPQLLSLSGPHDLWNVLTSRITETSREVGLCASKVGREWAGLKRGLAPVSLVHFLAFVREISGFGSR